MIRVPSPQEMREAAAAASARSSAESSPAPAVLPGRDEPAMRVLHGLLMSALLALVFVADWWIGRQAVFTAALGALVAVGLWEFYRLAERAGCRPASTFGIVSGLVLVGLLWLQERLGMRIGLDLVALTAAAVVVGAVIAQVAQHGVSGAWANVGATVLGLVCVWFLGVFIWRIRQAGGVEFGGLWPLAAFVATVKLSDIGAYAVGRTLGGRRLAKVVSPKKTVAGAVGGVVVGVLVAAAIRVIWPAAVLHMSVLATVGFGVAVSVAGMLGDLGESVLKRAAGVKDAGGLVPGFGGVLDVIDSVWGAAPVAYVFFALASRAGG
jgi:phosphatidate cytidylyltransferase